MENQLKKLNFENLPQGVTASFREDSEGGSYFLFEHCILGAIGRMFIADKGEEETCLTYEIFMGEEKIDNMTLNARQNILQQIVDLSYKIFD